MGMNIGSSQSSKFIQSISDKPTCKNSKPVVRAITKGKNIKVPCNQQAFPSATSFRWVLNETNSSKPELLHQSSGKLTLYSQILNFPDPNQADQHLGELYCWGSNWVGEAQKPCIFNLVATGDRICCTN